ncbi:MAG: hypothetical protein ACREBO_01525 [Novosphingobium sp.]
MHRFGIMLACAALLPASAAIAAPGGIGAMAAKSNTQNTRLVGSVREADLEALVLAEGHTIDAKHPFESPSVRGKTKDGLLFVLIGTACDKNGIPGCRGIMMQVRYDQNDTVTWERMGKASLAEAALAAWWDQEGETVGFTRYVVLDNGVTWMNIRQNLRVLLSIQESDRATVFD